MASNLLHYESNGRSPAEQDPSLRRVNVERDQR